MQIEILRKEAWNAKLFETFSMKFLHKTKHSKGLNLVLTKNGNGSFFLKIQPFPYLVLSNMKKSFNRLSKMRKQIDMQYSQIDFELHTDGSLRGGESECYHSEVTTL